MITLILATRNSHKVEEIRKILGDVFRYLTLSDFENAPEVIEDGSTFEQNAIKKSQELATWIAADPARLSRAAKDTEVAYVVADDSGLEVDALNGAPGVYSARFASDETGSMGNSGDEANNAKLLRMLENVPEGKRTARFRCVIAVSPVNLKNGAESSRIQIFEGTCEGKIASVLSGVGGFGYDPLFVPDGYDQSFAELGSTVKNSISHRGRALEQMRESTKF